MYKRQLEAFGAADTIIFDKTGTLTEACPQVSQVIAFGDYERNEVLRKMCIRDRNWGWRTTMWQQKPLTGLAYTTEKEILPC